jgi:hypothetical protein
MTGYRIIFSRVLNVIPELLALRECPTICALVNRDKELLSPLKEFEEVRFVGFHIWYLFVARKTSALVFL